MGQKKIVVIGLSTEENWQQVLWPLTTGNKKKFNIDCAVFDTFRGFLRKLYAATMDGKGREGT